jgi:hypothetical protein
MNAAGHAGVPCVGQHRSGRTAPLVCME